jgi:hypothetical protein
MILKKFREMISMRQGFGYIEVGLVVFGTFV